MIGIATPPQTDTDRLCIHMLSTRTASKFVFSFPKPPARLSWLINGEAPDLKLVKTIAGHKRSDGLESSRIDLMLHSERGHYRNGLLKLQCLSNIVQPYNVNSEEVVIGENSKYLLSPQLGK